MAAQRGDARAAAIHAVEDKPVSAIRFDEVRLTFAGQDRDVVALDRVSFDVPPGKITSVVGPSGCGKTTLLRLASGLVSASAGSVFCSGARVDSLNTSVGFVTQDSNLFPWLTAVGNVEFPLAIRGMLLMQYNQAMEISPMFAVILLLGVIGFLMNYAVTLIERRYCFWAQRSTATERP